MINFEESDQALICNMIINSLPDNIKEKFICDEASFTSYKFIIFDVTNEKLNLDI